VPSFFVKIVSKKGRVKKKEIVLCAGGMGEGREEEGESEDKNQRQDLSRGEVFGKGREREATSFRGGTQKTE
jgi:hypothetical protein